MVARTELRTERGSGASPTTAGHRGCMLYCPFKQPHESGAPVISDTGRGYMNSNVFYITGLLRDCVLYKLKVSNSICSCCVSVSHFGSSHNIPDSFVTILVTVICGP